MTMARRWLQRRPLLYRWLPVVAWMGFIFYLSAQPDLPHPGSGWVFKLISNGAHAFVFGVLAVLWVRVLNNRPRVLPVAFALTMAYALSDEFHQAFVPGRQPDVLDLVFDGLGAVVGLLLWTWWKRHSARKSQVQTGA
jgi:VanZ family protein